MKVYEQLITKHENDDARAWFAQWMVAPKTDETPAMILLEPDPKVIAKNPILKDVVLFYPLISKQQVSEIINRLVQVRKELMF